MYRDPGIQLDPAWHPQKVSAVIHALTGHPLLELDAIVALGKRLGQKGSVRYHNAAAQFGTDFSSAPETHKAALTVAESLERIEEAQAWMALHNIQQDDTYRKLVDEVLDFVTPLVRSRDPGMCSRAGWIFVSSPNAVTPYHLDHENNFILQIHGTKTLHVWEPLDREVVTDRALEEFHGRNSRDLVRWSQAIETRAHVFDLKPGMGGYMPQTAPHAVKNGPGVSVTLSVTYLTRATRRRAMLHWANHRLRTFGWSPSPPGNSKLADAVKAVGVSSVLAAARVVGRGPPAPSEYADASNLVPV